jgi:hypothetical protein
MNCHYLLPPVTNSGHILWVLFPVEILVRYRKFPAAFEPSGFKNFATVSGGHAAAKAVFVHSFSSGWLECPLHNAISFLGVQKYGFFLCKQT